METKTVVEYRFIPRSIYEDQFGPAKLESSFQDMFEKQDVFFRMTILKGSESGTQEYFELHSLQS